MKKLLTAKWNFYLHFQWSIIWNLSTLVSFIICSQAAFSQMAMRREASSDPRQSTSCHIPKFGLARLMDTHSPPAGAPTAQLSKVMALLFLFLSQ